MFFNWKYGFFGQTKSHTKKMLIINSLSAVSHWFFPRRHGFSFRNFCSQRSSTSYVGHPEYFERLFTKNYQNHFIFMLKRIEKKFKMLMREHQTVIWSSQMVKFHSRNFDMNNEQKFHSTTNLFHSQQTLLFYSNLPNQNSFKKTISYSIQNIKYIFDNGAKNT